MLAVDAPRAVRLEGSVASGLSSHSSLRTLPGPLSIISSIVRTNGVRGLWLGQTGTLIRETGGSAAWFTARESVVSYLLARRAAARDVPRSSLTKADLEMWESALAGAVAGVAYNVALFPADSVKSAVQTEEELKAGRGHHAGPATTFWDMAKKMYARQGVRGLYAGCGITVARAIPSSAMIFLIYDGLTKRFTP